MRILSIGNSFSVDAQTYVRDIAAAAGENIELGNLYIGGCSLERHMNNVRSGEKAYDYYINARNVALSDIETPLTDGKWDYITLQQASHFSGKWETYQPYLSDLAAYVRKLQPRAKLVIHETWAYESTSQHQAFPNYNQDRFYMHDCLKAAYEKAAEELNAGMIPVGNAVSLARENAAFDPEKGGVALTRDGFHLSLTLGRFLAGAVWFEYFTGKDVRGNTFVPQRYQFVGHDAQTGEVILKPISEFSPTEEQMTLLRRCAHEAVAACKKG